MTNKFEGEKPSILFWADGDKKQKQDADYLTLVLKAYKANTLGIKYKYIMSI